MLREHGILQLFIGGLATDYCVRASVLDALREGFEVAVIVDVIRGVDQVPGDIALAIVEMAAADARFARSTDLLKEVLPA